MRGNVIATLKRFLRDESGPTTVEYAVMVMLIITACVTVVQLIGGATQSGLQDSATKINDATNRP